MTAHPIRTAALLSLFLGAGPYELYTEVAVSKIDGHIISAYVEID